MVADKKTSTITGGHLPLFAPLSKTICNHLTLVRYYHYLYVSITAVRYGLFVFMLSKLLFSPRKTKVSSARNFYSSLSLSPSKSKIMHKVVDKR